MAYHSAQGPKLGVPQLVQSRAQFGFYGALLPNFLIWLIFLGYIVGENVLAAQALAGLWHITYAEAMVIACFVTWLVVFFGYRIMHDFNRVTAVAALVLFAVLLVRLLQHASGATIDMTGFHFSTWLLFFSINVSGQVGWAPYVSDYSRYLRSRGRSRPRSAVPTSPGWSGSWWRAGSITWSRPASRGTARSPAAPPGWPRPIGAYLVHRRG
jgi:nucleobase:cation symporter-1, NCS1 family